MDPFRRTLVYSVVGVIHEVAFSALYDLVRGERVRLRTSAWMFPIYALITPLYEPLHDGMRERVARPARGAVYGLGFLAVEYATGAALRCWRGEAPWDYSYARIHIDGLIRPDYVLLWAAAGLALEPLHDHLVHREA